MPRRFDLAQHLAEEHERAREQRVQIALRGRAVTGPAEIAATYEAWHLVGAADEPGFDGDWQNAPGGLASPARFFKDPFGFVYIAGRVVMTNVAGGYSVFTLPAGYRPAHYYEFGISQRGGSEYLSIFPAGEVRADFGPVVGTDYQIDIPPFRVV